MNLEFSVVHVIRPYVTLPPEISCIDTQSQYRMRRFSICGSDILIFDFHPNWVLQALFCSKTTFNGRMWCFMTVSGILNCNCCNTVVCETNFLSRISQNGTLYGSQIDLSITFEPVADLHNFGIIWKENECSLQCKSQNFMKSINVTPFGEQGHIFTQSGSECQVEAMKVCAHG